LTAFVFARNAARRCFRPPHGFTRMALPDYQSALSSAVATIALIRNSVKSSTGTVACSFF
jgi:hypothetical protein